MPAIHYVVGASGSGKSTYARLLADERRALGQQVEVISTDVIRAGLRAVLERSRFPELWAESFNVPLTDSDEVVAASNGESVNVSGFARQCRPIVEYLQAAVSYAISEGWDVVAEGVHLVPGTFALTPSPGAHSLAIEVTHCVPANHAAHRRMFTTRGEATAGARPAAHYHDNLPRIQVIQEHIAACLATAAASPEWRDVTVETRTTGQ